MAFTFTLAQGGQLIIPDSAVNINVISNPSGISTSGVVALVGEADEGPSWSQDSANGNKLSANSFGVTDIASVVQKYGSGNLVDAYRAIVAPSSSPRIQGGPNRIIMVKPNNSTPAFRVTSDNHGRFQALRGGESGNSIQESVATSVAEAAASTDEFSYVPSASGSSLAARVNGGAKQTLAISANETPSALAAAITGLANLNAVGGVDRLVLAGLAGQNIQLDVVSGQDVSISLATPNIFSGAPAVGDTIRIPSGSVIQGAGNANVGWYQVTTVSNTLASAFIQMSRLSNGLPVAVSATAVAATSDIQDLDPQIKGVGKTLELYDNAGAVNVNTVLLQLGVTPVAAASWLQQLTVSSAELQKQITLARNSTNSLENFNAGGSVALTIGYDGTSATATIAVVSNVLRLTTSVVGGSGGNLNMDLSKIATIADLASKIAANTGYSAAVGSTADGQKNPSILDQMTLSIASNLGNRPGRVKHDLWDITANSAGLNVGSKLANYTPSTGVTAGMPEDNAAAFLSGGDKGGSTGLQMSQAIDALQGVRCNFVVPLVSRDASADIADGETEASSTYTVDAINAAVKSHVLNMSTAKTKRHRIGIVSKKSTFAVAKQSARTMSTFRIAHVFQDIVTLNSQAQLETFQPWMGAAMAAGMQSAGAYKAIFPKSLNISGIKHQDFDDENNSQVEDALSAGLIPIQTQEDGSLAFASDQMTYGLDNNFVYNSLQAVYVADLMALSLASALKKAFVGESVADVTNGAVQSFVEAKMAEFLALKFTVGTKAAPGGWKSIAINIIPGVLMVRVVAVEATAIYFIPIDLDIEGIQSSSTTAA